MKLSSKIPLLNPLQARDWLRNGNLLIYKTDTLYGLGCDATNPNAVKRLRKLKGISEDKPISCMLGNIDSLKPFIEASELTTNQLALIQSASSLESTFLLEPKNDRLQAIQGSSPKVGFRLNALSENHELFSDLDFPIVTTSANLTSHENAKDLEQATAPFSGNESIAALSTDNPELNSKFAGSTLIAFEENQKVSFLRVGNQADKIKSIAMELGFVF